MFFGSGGTRRQAKIAREMVRHARHLRNMRDDLMTPEERRRLDAAERGVEVALGCRRADPDGLASACAALDGVVVELQPARWRSSLRENVEILVVAISVAMAFRAYFIQPFKIPTGSMQPTLYGIHSVTHQAPTVMDRFPLKLAKLAVTGTWYSERRAKVSGHCTGAEDSGTDPSVRYFFIGTVRHRMPKDADMRGELRFAPGSRVTKGDLLWAGYVTRGDHLFVNKVIWNFRKPRRGEIMVFSTADIPSLPAGTHYIKRMVGLPNEGISIAPPYVCADGRRIESPEPIARIAARQPGYAGYRLIHAMEGGHLHQPTDVYQLGASDYFALGDNTSNSRDSRYWGKVPAVNLTGPAALVYWPVSSRWGLAR